MNSEELIRPDIWQFVAVNCESCLKGNNNNKKLFARERNMPNPIFFPFARDRPGVSFDR